MTQNTPENKEAQFVLTLDLHSGELDLLQLSESIKPPQGIYTSFIVGTRYRLEDIRKQLIMGTLNKILKIKVNGGVH